MKWFLVAFVLVSASTNAQAGEQRYAVVIGNNHGAKGDRPLRYAERDANQFSSVLRRFGGLAAENNVVLVGESQASIRRALLEVNARIRADGQEHTTLIVYYSGHASDDGLHLGENTLSYRELRAIMRGSPAKVRLLVIDACRSGGLTNVKGGRPTEEFDVRASVPDVEGLVMISSSAAGEDSHESDRLGASFFSHHFTNALLGAGDEDGDERITLTEAYAYAYRNTLRTSGYATSLQHPTYKYDLKGRGDLVMTRLGSKQTTTAALELAEAGLYLVLDDGRRGDVIAEVRAPRDNTRIALPPSQYVVQRREDDHYREYEVELRAGQTAALDRMTSRRVSYARLVRKGSELRSMAHEIYGLAGARGGLQRDMGAGYSGLVGYGINLQYLSIATRLRYGRGRPQALGQSMTVQHEEFSIGLAAQHFFDLPFVSLGVGLSVEVIHHEQLLESPTSRDRRSAIGAALAGLFTLEAVLYGPLVLHIEGGPVTYVFEQTIVEAGRESGKETATPMTGFVMAGVGVQF